MMPQHQPIMGMQQPLMSVQQSIGIGAMSGGPQYSMTSQRGMGMPAPQQHQSQQQPKGVGNRTGGLNDPFNSLNGFSTQGKR